MRRTASEAAGRLLRALRPRPPAPPAVPGDPGVVLLLDAEAGAGVPLRERVLISCLGLAEPNLEAQLEAAARAVEADGRHPVIAATDLPLAYVVASPRAVELLPPRARLAVLTAPEYEAYLRRRWTFLRARWVIRRDIVLGASFEGFLADQLGLPVP